MRERILHWGIWTTIITAMVLLLYVLYLLIWPFQTIQVNTQLNKVLTPVVTAGEDVVFLFDYCRITERPSTITRTLRNDAFSAPLGVINSSAVPGCYVLEARVPIPGTIPPGRYFVYSVNVTEVNPLRTIAVPHSTEPFEVINNYESQI